MSEQTYSEVDALLQEFQNLPLGETDALFANTELGTTFVNDQLGEIFIAFLSQFFTPDITTYRSTCDSLMPLISLALLAGKTRQLLLDILELADVMFESSVSASLTLQEGFDPQYFVPTHSIARIRLIDIINQCLTSPHDSSDIRSELLALRSNIQERENQAKAALLASDIQWIHDLAEIWPEFKALDPSYTSTEAFPNPTAQLGPNSAMNMGNPRVSELTRLMGASRHLSTLSTTSSRPIKSLPARGASVARMRSLSAMLSPRVSDRVLSALGTVAEEEMQVD
ncbi:uncharacterized protein F5891DRAFT_727158 [Suillus fuscotomentosus]|uniref:Uncharacterized protein n=1 Tax=Suillus fuscotomentosus TaxID=1912939 RepID=A0AAD4DV24_9AGAM|nr:uncharacterized protein F5891DRAFT_727158 [Suillus fuscotomentosus]KAG1894407.1 hypothetical protein F5891DRAFT_727158 [Suillus fuscotomentosus]